MNVFILTHETFDQHTSSGMRSFDVFATEKLALNALAGTRKTLASHDWMVIEDHEDKRGFSYGAKMGSSSFIPGQFKVTEHAVLTELPS